MRIIGSRNRNATPYRGPGTTYCRQPPTASGLPADGPETRIEWAVPADPPRPAQRPVAYVNFKLPLSTPGHRRPQSREPLQESSEVVSGKCPFGRSKAGAEIHVVPRTHRRIVGVLENVKVLGGHETLSEQKNLPVRPPVRGHVDDDDGVTR